MTTDPLESIIEGFYDVCRGTAMVPEAPAYAGPPPHLVYAPVPHYVDRAWWANEPSRVQLVVCTETTDQPGTRLRTCTYRSSDGTTVVQPLIKGTWNVVIREAKTGREIARSSIVGGTTACGQGPDYDSSSLPIGFAKVQLTRPTQRQRYDTIGKYVLG